MGFKIVALVPSKVKGESVDKSATLLNVKTSGEFTASRAVEKHYGFTTGNFMLIAQDSETGAVGVAFVKSVPDGFTGSVITKRKDGELEQAKDKDGIPLYLNDNPETPKMEQKIGKTFTRPEFEKGSEINLAPGQYKVLIEKAEKVLIGSEESKDENDETIEIPISETFYPIEFVKAPKNADKAPASVTKTGEVAKKPGRKAKVAAVTA